MAIAVRSSTTLAFGTRANSTFTAPAGIVNDDILLCILNVGDATLLPALAVTAPAGWTEAPGSPVAANRSDPYTISQRVYWKKAASESGSYTFTHTSAGTEGFMYCLSGAHTTAPLSPTPTTAIDNGSNGITTTAPTLTTLVAGCFIVMAEALWDDTDVGGVPMDVPAGTTPTFTQRLKGTLLYISDGTLAAAGATGARSHTNGNAVAAAPWACFHISVQPAAAAGDLTVTGAQTTSAATQTSDITTVAFPALAVIGAQTTNACVTAGTIGDVTPAPEPQPVAPGGPSRAAQRRLKQAIENRSRFEAERAQRLANLTNDRPLFVTPPETLKIINETLVEAIDHSVLFENEDQDEELLLLLMMI